MVSTRKSREEMADKKSDRKRKRVRGDDGLKDLQTTVHGKDIISKYSKEGKNLVLKSDVEEKSLWRHAKKKVKSVACIDSDFEGSQQIVEKEIEVEHNKQKIVPMQKHLKIWDLFYEEHHRNFTAKVIYWCDLEVPNIIKSKLSDVQLKKFKLSCFGKFLEFGQPQMFSQIIHHALVREVYQRDNGEMWFIFGERWVRFGLPEFSLLSGLNWKGDEDIEGYKGIENLFVEFFFGNEVVTRSSIGRIYRSASFNDDDEAVRMSIIFLVFNFILATVSDNYVDEALFNFLCHGDFERYPWGKVAFEQTKKSLSLALKGHVKKDKYGGVMYNFFREGYCKSYKLNGLPYVFQVFLFETIPTLKVRGFCIDDNVSEFRLFRWRELGKPPTNVQLNDLVFGSGQLIVQNIVPTEDEKVRLELSGFHFFSTSDSGPKISDIKVELSRKGKDFRFSISDLKKVIDARVKPLEGKVREVKKDIEELGVVLKDHLELLHIQFCRDMKKMLRKYLKRQSSYTNRKNVSVDDGDDDDDDDNDDFELDDNVGAGNVNFVADDVMNVDDDVVVEVPGNSKPFHSGVDADAGGVGGIQFEEDDTKGYKMDTEDISPLDQMILTTQDIADCVEVEKSAHMRRGRPIREQSKSAFLRSPYTTKFGSASSYSKGDTQIRTSICAFPKLCMAMPSKYEDALFDQWFKIGLNNRKRTDKFPGVSNKIYPSFMFGSIPISSKMWFYKLKTPGQWLDDDHINIALYYFRKLVRQSDSVHIRATTTDCLFHAKITALNEAYTSKNSDKSLLTGDCDIAKYVRGFSMEVNTPWFNVDYVLFPIHMSSPPHWFLLTFDVHRRLLQIYNSLQPTSSQIQSKIMDICEPYIFILPIILSNCDFWRDRTDIDFKSEPYCNKAEQDIIELEFVKWVPEQSDGDCGMFTICFAEHVIHQQIDELPVPFPIAQYRKKLCVNLYMHARTKQLEGYETDDEYADRFAQD